MRRTVLIFGFVGFLVCTAATAMAQDLEPRAYAAAPIGANFIVVGVGRSSGGVVTDPSLPIEDVEATINAATIGVGTTFSLFGRSALVVAAFPYAWGTISGQLNESATSVTRSGLADPRLKLSVNLVGGRALTPEEFVRAKRPTIVGVSLSVAPPLGQYDPSKLVNLGANRWSFKPEVGISRLIDKWAFDGYAGVLLFTANDQFYTGFSIRTQAPIFALQGHMSYTFKPRLWLAFDGTWYSGGTTNVDGIDKQDLQRNSRFGATASFPLFRQQSIKAAVSRGATTRVGANFTTVSVAWQFSWLN
jgi:Putative MetA-pathway of phenol degradation